MKYIQDLLSGVPLESLILYFVGAVAILRNGRGNAPSMILSILELLRKKEPSTPQAFTSNGKRR